MLHSQYNKVSSNIIISSINQWTSINKKLPFFFLAPKKKKKEKEKEKEAAIDSCFQQIWMGILPLNK